MSKDNTEGTMHDQLSGTDATAQALIELIDEFIMVVTEENAALASGLPSSLAPISKRKVQLADSFDLWVKAAVAREFRIATASPAMRRRFVDGLKRFQGVMSENMAHLEAAMEASRGRIEAVMTVIRDEVSNANSYGANGKTYKVGGAAVLRSGYV